MTKIIGQSHLIGPKGVISKLIENENLGSIILYGLPGIGKSTLAKYILSNLNEPLIIYNAATDDTKFLKEILQSNYKYIIIEEIHNLNKTKQNMLLPFLEDNLKNIIGCTTENPFQVLLPALRSRVHLFQLIAPDFQEIVDFLTPSLISLDLLNHLFSKTGNDLRYFLNSYSLLTQNYEVFEITIELIDQIIIANTFTKSFTSSHYDLVSGLQKSIRHSDLDSAMYFLSALIKLNDLAALTRRLAIIAAEDIGIANPNLVNRTINLLNYCHLIGIPEANYILSMIVFELALSPKSTTAIETFYKADQYLALNPNHSINKAVNKNYYRSLTLEVKNKISYANLSNIEFWPDQKGNSKYEKAYYMSYLSNKKKGLK